MRGWLLKDQEIIEEEANAVIRASRVSLVRFCACHRGKRPSGDNLQLLKSLRNSTYPRAPGTESISSISAPAAMEDYRQGQTLIVDAMPNNFYRKRHIKGAVNMPHGPFRYRLPDEFFRREKDKKIVVYGNTISRPYDLEIADKLLLRGYTDVKVLDGGLRAWEANGYPVDQKVSK